MTPPVANLHRFEVLAVVAVVLIVMAALAAFRFGPSAWRGWAGAGLTGRPRSAAPFGRRRKYRDGRTSGRARWRRFLVTSALSDRRDRHGFASARQLRQEASVTAARRRAAQTRPSLRANKRRLAP